jgi:hypothetical protein
MLASELIPKKSRKWSQHFKKCLAFTFTIPFRYIDIINNFLHRDFCSEFRFLKSKCSLHDCHNYRYQGEEFLAGMAGKTLERVGNSGE